MEIKKGETTQADILKIFGSPNLVTKNRDNDEVWNYNRMSYEAAYGSDAGGFIFWGGSRAVSSTTVKSFDLIIIFDNNDVVKDYSIIAASF
jgi:outer membrane protein assembly factor BamE (lipoprotein component of BamABCDE complex)